MLGVVFIMLSDLNKIKAPGFMYILWCSCAVGCQS